MTQLRTSAIVAAIVALVSARPASSILGDEQSLTYQAHSINDLNAVRQLLVRGVQFFKIDARFLDRESCATMSTWNSSLPCYPSDVPGKEFCCIGFRGDTTGGPTLTQPFNTTDDFLAMLGDPAVVAALHRRGNGDSLTHFNFDNQWSGDAVNGTALADFAPLLTGFMLALDSRIRALELADVVTIDADFGVLYFADAACSAAGSAAPCTGTLRALSALPFRAETGFPPNGNPRAVVANVPYSSFHDQCAAAFPGHAKVDAFPYIFWEPSTQADILAIRDAWAACPSVPATHSLANRGLRNTCNQEPEMYSVFAADSSNDGQALLPGLNEPLFPPQARVPLAAVPAAAPPATADDPTTFLLAVPADPAANAPVLTLRGFRADTHTLLPPAASAGATMPLPSLAAPADAPVAVAADTSGLAVVVSARGRVVVAKLDSAAGRLFRAGNGSLSLPTPTSALLDLALCPANPATALVLSTDADGPCAVSLSLVALPLAGSAAATAGRADACVLPQSAGTRNATFQGSLALAVASNSTAGDGDCGGRGLLALVDAAAATPFLKFAVVEAGAASVVVRGDVDPASASGLRDTGREPSVAGGVVDGEAHFAVVHTDGMCECGFGINNGDMDHCSISAGAQPPLRSVDNLLNFNVAPLSVWATAVDDALHRPTNLSFCHPTIVHGKVDTGRAPSAALVTASVLGETRPSVVALVNADVPAAPLTNAFCGAPVRKHNVTLDAWRVPPPSWMASM